MSQRSTQDVVKKYLSSPQESGSSTSLGSGTSAKLKNQQRTSTLRQPKDRAIVRTLNRKKRKKKTLPSSNASVTSRKSNKSVRSKNSSRSAKSRKLKSGNNDPRKPRNGRMRDLRSFVSTLKSDKRRNSIARSRLGDGRNAMWTIPKLHADSLTSILKSNKKEKDLLTTPQKKKHPKDQKHPSVEVEQQSLGTATLDSRRGRRRPVEKKVLWYPISQVYVYEDTAEKWYEDGDLAEYDDLEGMFGGDSFVLGDNFGDEFDQATLHPNLTFDDCAVLYLGIESTFHDLITKRLSEYKRHPFQFSDEIAATKYWAQVQKERKKIEKQNRNRQVMRKVDDSLELKDMIKEIKEMLLSPTEAAALVDDFINSVGNLNDMIIAKGISEEKSEHPIETIYNFMQQQSFREVMIQYVMLCLMNKALENKRCLKVFCHKYLEIAFNEHSDETLKSETLELYRNLFKIFSSVDYVKCKELLETPQKKRLGLSEKLLNVLQHKLFARIGGSNCSTRKSVSNFKSRAGKLDESRRSFRSNKDENRYVDVISLEEYEPSEYDEVLFKTTVPEAWTNMDLLGFLDDTRVLLDFQLNRWAILYLKVLNSGLATSMINNRTSLTNYLVDLKLPQSVHEVLDALQKRSSIIRKPKTPSPAAAAAAAADTEDQEENPDQSDDEDKSQRSEKTERSEKSATSNREKHDKQDKQQTEKVDPNAPRELVDFRQRLMSTAKTVLVKKKDARRPLFGGNSLKGYLDSNAFSLHLNPLVRADLQFSRRKQSCFVECSGHQGVLLLTAIRQGSVSSVELLLKSGVKPNLKVCQGNSKELKWVGVNYSSVISDFLYKSQYNKKMKRKTVTKHLNYETIQGSGGSKVFHLIRGTKAWLDKNKSRFLSLLSRPSNGSNVFGDSDIRSDLVNENKDKYSHLKSRFYKVSPLGVSISCFLDSTSSQTSIKHREIIQVLLDYGAQATYCNNYGVTSLRSFIKRTVEAKSLMQSESFSIKKQSKVKSQLDIDPSRPQRPKLKIAKAIPLDEDSETKKFIFAIQETYGGKTPKSGLVESRIQVTNEILTRAKLEVLRKMKKGKLQLGGKVNKWDSVGSMVCSVSLFLDALLVCDYSAALAVIPPSDSPQTHSIVAQCLSHTLHLLNFSMNKPTAANFHVLLAGFVFILIQYEILPSRVQMTNVMRNITQHLQSNSIQRASVHNILKTFFDTDQVKYYLLLESSKKDPNEIQFSHLPLLISTSNKKHSLLWSRRSHWRATAKRWCTAVSLALVKSGHLELFSRLLQPIENQFKANVIEKAFFQATVVNRSISVYQLPHMLSIMKNLSLNTQKLADKIFTHSVTHRELSSYAFCLIQNDFKPKQEVCQDFVRSCLVNRPLLSPSDDFYYSVDRMRDLSDVRLFHHFLFTNLFNKHLLNDRANKTRMKDFLRATLFLQDIASILDEIKPLEEPYIWYGAIRDLLVCLDEFFITPLGEEKSNPTLIEQCNNFNSEMTKITETLVHLVVEKAQWELFYEEEGDLGFRVTLNELDKDEDEEDEDAKSTPSF